MSIIVIIIIIIIIVIIITVIIWSKIMINVTWLTLLCSSYLINSYLKPVL